MSGNCRKRKNPSRPAKSSREDRFARRVAEVVAECGVASPLRYDPLRFALVAKGEEQVLFLTDLYAEYEHELGAASDEVLVNLVRSWFSRPAAMPEHFVDARACLLPDVNARVMYEAVRLAAGDDREEACMPYRPLGEHFGAGLVYHQPDGKFPVTAGNLAAWGVTFEDAFNSARDNLRGRFREPLRTAARGVWVSPREDGYDSAWLVLPDVLRQYPVRGEHVAMSPNTATFILTGTEEEAGLAFMASAAPKEFREGWAVSGVALRLEGESWVPFLPGPDHLHHYWFKTLGLMAGCVNYRMVEERLDRIHASRGRFCQVGRYFVGRDSGQACGYAVWKEGVETLLPRAEKVAFVRADATGEVQSVGAGEWQRVQEVVGGLMEPLGGYPEYFRVRTFPTAEQLAAVGMSPIPQPERT